VRRLRPAPAGSAQPLELLEKLGVESNSKQYEKDDDRMEIEFTYIIILIKILLKLIGNPPYRIPKEDEDNSHTNKIQGVFFEFA
jgi:hypothetical protein